MTNTIERVSELSTFNEPELLRGSMFQYENQAHTFVIECTQDGQHVDLQGDITARFMRADRNTVYLAPAAQDPDQEAVANDLTTIDSQGRAVVTLHRDCYNVPGRFQLAVYNVNGGRTVCIYACVGAIRLTQAGALIDSGEAFDPASFSDDIAALGTLIQQTNAAKDAANAAAASVAGDVADLKSAFGNTVKQQIAFVQTANSTTSNYYKTFATLSAEKCYLIRLTVETAGTYTLKFGTGQSSAAMVDTVGEATVQANIPHDFIGYVPSLSTLTTARLSVSTPYSIDIYEIENIGDIKIACIRSSDKIINTAGRALAPYNDLDTLPTNETVTYVNASGLNIQHVPNFGNFTVMTFTPYAESNDGGKIQVAYRADSGFGMAFRSYWGSAYTDWKYVAIEGHTDEVQALQSDAIKSSNKLVNTNGSAQAPYNDMDTLPVNDVVTYVGADNLGILHRPNFKSYTVISTSYINDNVGGTVQIAFAINSTFGMAYRNRWGTNAAFGDWYYISSKNDVADSIVADLPFTSISCFLRIGVIGDSYASGWLNVSGSTKDWYNISWIQQMAREYGVTGINFSKAGLTTRSWLTDENGLTKLNNTDPCDLYWIVLGINDVETLGLDYLGSIADCTETPLSNPDTFYGNMGRIMYYVQQQAPHAHIIFSTMANSSGNYPAFNAAIQEIATHYGVGCIVQLDDPFFTSRFYTVYKRSSHPTVQLYGGMSKAIARLTDKCMRANPGYFNDIWPTSEP